MILVMVLCANLGDTMLKRGMNQIRAVELSRAGLVHALRLTVTKGALWIGILFLIAFTASYMAVMSWADYSDVMPARAFGSVLLTLLAVVFLHENVSPHRWIGVLLTCIGVFLVSRTKPRTTEAVQQVTA